MTLPEELKKAEIKFMYLTEKEQKLPTHDALLQIVLGLQTCKTKESVIELLQDIRALQQQRDYSLFASFLETKKKELKERLHEDLNAGDSCGTCNIVDAVLGEEKRKEEKGK